MLRSLGNMLGSAVLAKDVEIWKVHDFYFDDQTWIVRYPVVETGDWLRRRRVLISTSALGKPEWQGHLFPVELTQEQVRSSPDVDTDKPVSRQHEIAMNAHYNWPHYWLGEPTGADPMPIPLPADLPEEGETSGDPHLRSLREVNCYSLQNEGSRIGLVDDFTVDDEKWVIRYLVIATGSHWPRKRVLIGSSWVGQVLLAAKEIRTTLTQADLGNSPEFDPATFMDRKYELRLYEHHGRPRSEPDGRGPSGHRDSKRGEQQCFVTDKFQ